MIQLKLYEGGVWYLDSHGSLDGDNLFHNSSSLRQLVVLYYIYLRSAHLLANPQLLLRAFGWELSQSEYAG